MNRNFTLNLIVAANLLLCFSATAQSTDNPGEYMTAMVNARGDMDAKYMQYMSAAAHGRRASKVEKLRQEVLDNITNSRYKTIDLPIYKGDNSLRQSSIDYIQLCYTIFNEDYKKIINMEELAEQSVDEMQVYLLLQEKIDEKLHEGYAALDKVTHEFAAKYNVTLTTEQTPLGTKLEEAGKVNTYTNTVYLIFFKCNWEDNQMVKALNAQKVIDAEQARNALLSYANEGLKSLDTIKPFEGDPSLVNACKQALTFYKQAAESDMTKLMDFYVRQEEFNKLKQAFDAGSNHTQADVNAYNKAVKDVNNSVKSFNQTNTKVNNGRTQTVNAWTAAEKDFQDQHVPHYR
ncbi:MAG TPA: hypothetical protein VFE32_00480 [Puia sp.]|jgi:hypothetical protein|nr:hypothetical protein [Puia sp.]